MPALFLQKKIKTLKTREHLDVLDRQMNLWEDSTTLR